MKTNIRSIISACLLFAAGLAVCITQPGCGSINKLVASASPEQIAKVSKVIENLTANGASAYLAKNDGSAPYLVVAAGVIEASAESGVLAPADVQAAIAKHLPGDGAGQVSIALSAAFGVYQLFVGANVDSKLDTKPAFKAALLSIAKGLRNAASPVPAAGPPVNLKLSHADLVLHI